MSEEITKDRSPRSPMSSLEDAIELIRRFYAQARTAAVKPESAVKAMGYSGMTGTSMTALGTLGQYGLIERTSGNITVSSLAVRILHPSSDAQKDAAIREAATLPKVFQSQLNGFEHCAPEIITNHLIQEGFAPDRAKKVAQVYLENRRFAKLDEAGSAPVEDSLSPSNDTAPLRPRALSQTTLDQNVAMPHPLQSQAHPRKKVLTTFRVPFALSEAEIIFTGERIDPEDFDALADYVAIFKKQYQRKAKVVPAPQSALADELEVALSTFKPRFTVKEASEHAELCQIPTDDFPRAWGELIRSGTVVMVDVREPNLYSIKNFT